jgi:hypothetical protein
MVIESNKVKFSCYEFERHIQYAYDPGGHSCPKVDGSLPPKAELPFENSIRKHFPIESIIIKTRNT